MADTTENISTPAKRVRKQAEFFTVPSTEKKKEVKISSGKGIKLVEYEHFVQELTKHKSDEDLVKQLHSLMYGSIGRKANAKHNLREFSGFSRDVDLQEKIEKVTENKKKWTVALLKEALALFGLEKGGSREELCKRLVDYLSAPRIVVHNGKRPRSSLGKSPAKKARGSKGGEKKKRRKTSPSAYLLFCNAHRAEAKEENPDAGAKDIIKILAEMWNDASDKEKQKWQAKAEEEKAKLAAEQEDGDEESEEEEAEENEEIDVEEGAESDDMAESDKEEEDEKEKETEDNHAEEDAVKEKTEENPVEEEDAANEDKPVAELAEERKEEEVPAEENEKADS